MPAQFLPLQKHHIGPLYRLLPHPHQQGFVAPNAITMAEAPFEPGSEVYGIWEGERAVGLLALIAFAHPQQKLETGEDAGSLYIWRLLIDAEEQGKGYGSGALTFAEAEARKRGRTSVSLTHANEENGPGSYYAKFGYELTGVIIAGELQRVKIL